LALNFRALYRWMLPGNYTDDETDGGKVLHSLALIDDAFDQIHRDRVEARFPTYAGESALALIGADRAIPRGRAEIAEHYKARLRAWRYPRGHKTRGSAFALLEQIWEYFGGGFALNTEQLNAQQWHRDEDGVESTATVGGWDWDSDTNPLGTEQWARFWVVIDGTTLITETPDFGDADLYGGQIGDSSYAVGHEGVSADDVIAIRKLFRGRAWKPAGTRAMWAIVSLDGTTPLPEGAYQFWGRDDGAGNWEAARDSVNQRYWALDPTALLYAGDPDSFPLSADIVGGGGTEAGDPALFTASATFDGTVYEGDPDLFPSSAKLVDDGSIP
jgi:hypothetical protein